MSSACLALVCLAEPGRPGEARLYDTLAVIRLMKPGCVIVGSCPATLLSFSFVALLPFCCFFVHAVASLFYYVVSFKATVLAALLSDRLPQISFLRRITVLRIGEQGA